MFFGETKLLVKNQNNDNKSFLLWKTNTNITVSDNEQKIWEKIHPLLDNYLKRLFEIENNFSKHLRSKLTISSISKQSNIPVSGNSDDFQALRGNELVNHLPFDALGSAQLSTCCAILIDGTIASTAAPT